jgi:uncharacterized protein (TIGR02594 family)
MVTYTVRTGDTLSRIAQRYGVSLQQLLQSNPQIEDPDLIYPGQKINVPSSHPPAPVPPPGPPSDAPWFDIAKREMETGVDEIPGSRDNPRIIEYHASTTLKATDDETPWCSSFVNWCVEQAGLQGTKSAAARSWLQWGQALDQPRRGCIVVLQRGNSWQGHVGFYYADEGGRILVLGGNQSNQVNISSYRKSAVLGYRWPQ